MFSKDKTNGFPASLFLSIATLLAGLSAQAGTLFVDHDFQGESPTGESWLSAFPSLQGAIDASSAAGGGDIWVKSGVYKPEGADRSATFELKSDVAIYGGFRGEETNIVQRNPKANRTVLSGDMGRIGSTADNCFHVLTGANGCRIDGFIISRGNADSEEGKSQGGGLLIPDQTRRMIVADCTFEKNNANLGGAIYALNAAVRLTNCTFYSNSAKRGGAVGTEGDTTLQVEHTVFSSNYATESGGAFFQHSDTDAAFQNTTFHYNSSDGDGGAIFAEPGNRPIAKLTLTDCTFSQNNARKNGGAAAIGGPLLFRVSGCRFKRNSSAQGAGAIDLANGGTATLSENTFSGNKGIKGSEDITVTPATSNANAPKIVTKKPKPKRKLADVYIHNAQNTKVKLRSIIAEGGYTVLVLGDLTDPDFIKSYRTIEATARDYAPTGINFFYIYRHLLHPENHGFLQPFHQKERARQAQLAKEYLHTSIPWLYDLMDNQAAKALSWDGKYAISIFSAEGLELYAGAVSDTKGLRSALVKIAGKVEIPTSVASLPKPTIKPISQLEAKLVDRVKINPKSDKFLPLQITPLESKSPHYVKIRIEADDNLLKNGNGKVYLGFHIDPLYKVKWNNLGKPLKYTLKTPSGVVAPSINTAPRITGQVSDTEPREFLLDARKLDSSKPIRLQVVYSVRSTTAKRNINVQQQYIIYLKKDPFGGKVFGRQVSASAKPKGKTRTSSSGAFEALLRRFDLNRDGKLTKDETVGNLRTRFQKIDANQSGAIDKKEYLNYRKNR